MNTKPLSLNQQSILYSLLYHMVRNQELNLTSAAESGLKSENSLEYCRNVATKTLDLLDAIGGNLVVFQPLLSSTRRLMTSGELESVFYLGQHFAVDRSKLYFPGITPPAAIDDDDEAPEDRTERSAGDLRQEFPDPDSRAALITEIEHWTRLDAGFAPQPDGILAKVRSELEAQLVSSV